MGVAEQTDISLDRFFWVETFSTRLQELGAPASPERITELGQRLFSKYQGSGARDVADAVWARWPTDSGFVPSD